MHAGSGIKRLLGTATMLAAGAALAGCDLLPEQSQDGGKNASEIALQCISESAKIAITGGTFTMGSDQAYPEEKPVREATVGAFSISATEVTNAQFAEFVEATGYVTQAEQAPDPALHPDIPAALLKAGSAVFEPTPQPANMNWWTFVEGASWKEPDGPGSSIEGREHHPVVHVTYADALAYAEWAGGDLPTEEEWEFAARAGLDQATYEWGEEHPQKGTAKANTWQGAFPIADSGSDGYKGTAPVGCFPANAYGIHDMTGNVWEWTKSTGDQRGSNSSLVKGGSYLCADSYCARFRPAARQAQERDLSTDHIGFRVVFR